MTRKHRHLILTVNILAIALLLSSCSLIQLRSEVDLQAECNGIKTIAQAAATDLKTSGKATAEDLAKLITGIEAVRDALNVTGIGEAVHSVLIGVLQDQRYKGYMDGLLLVLNAHYETASTDQVIGTNNRLRLIALCDGLLAGLKGQ